MFSGFVVIGRTEAGLNSKFTGSNLDNVITHDAVLSGLLQGLTIKTLK